MARKTIEEAIEIYSKAFERRMLAKKRLHNSNEEDRMSRQALTAAKDDLRMLEIEMSEGIVSPQLTLSRIVLVKEERQPMRILEIEENMEVMV